MPLSKLLLRNFQAHRKLDIPLDPHVTTIVGPSDAGKSSVIRALRWVTSNKPNGNSFISTGKKKTAVALFLGQSKAIVRQRATSGGNAYRIACNGKETTYKAFGTAVPEPIAAMLRMNDLNFQEQHDSPFWFSLSDGEVSKRLNEVVNLSLIDSVMAKIAKKVRFTKERVEVHRELLKGAKESKRMLADTPEFCRELKLVNQKIAEWKRDFAAMNELREAMQSLEAAQKVAAEPVPDMTAVGHAQLHYNTARSSRAELHDLMMELSGAESRESTLLLELKQAERRFHKHVKGKTCPLCKHQM